MSYYGGKTFIRKFSVHKSLLQIGEGDRFSAGEPALAYKLEDGSPVELTLHHSGVYVIGPVESDVVLVKIRGIYPDPSTFSNIEIVTVADSYNLAPNKYAVVLGGSLSHDSVTIDGEADIGLFEGEESGKVLTGAGRILVLDFTP